jgi:drug/metabolite transporter (DMT)-like permease
MTTRYIALILTAILWASAFPGIRAGLAGYAPGHLVLLRFLAASAVLLVVWWFRGRPLPDRRDLPRITITAILSFTIYPFALSFGEMTVDAGTASILVNLSPVFTAIFALTIGERLNGTAIAGIAVAFAGATLVAGGGNVGGFTIGVVAVLLAAVVQATQFVLSKTLLRRYDAVSVTLYCVVIGTVADLVFARGFIDAVAKAPLSATLWVLYLGVLPTAFATIIWSWALAKVPTPVAASFLYLVPPVSIAIAWIALGERPRTLTWVGAAIAMAGVILVTRVSRHPEARRRRRVSDLATVVREQRSFGVSAPQDDDVAIAPRAETP